MAHGGANTVGASIAAANDDDVPVLGVDERVVGSTIEHGLGVGGEKLHRKVDTLERAALNREVARLRRAGADDGRVVFVEKYLGLDILADISVADEFDALVFHQLNATQHYLLFVELHVGDAIHEEATGAISALEDGDAVASAVELRRGGKAGRAGANDGDLLTGANLGRLRHNPALVPTAVNDGRLDVFDRDGGLVDAKDARTFARCGTHAAGEFRKVVCLVQALQRLLPTAAIDEIVPLRDQVVNRAAAGHATDELAGVAERHTAVHAARALRAELLFLHLVVKLLPVADALGRCAVHGKFAEIFDEAGGFAHGRKFRVRNLRCGGQNGMPFSYRRRG